MSPSKVFKIVNVLAVIPWVLMAIAPRWCVTDAFIDSNLIPLLLAGVYLGYIVATFGKTQGGFSTLEGVQKLFQNPKALLAGWIHYLVFDLWVGMYEYHDAPTHGMPHWVLVPCLFLTLMFGPIGFLLYFGLRYFFF